MHYTTFMMVRWRTRHYWADLQSLQGLHCCDNIARMQNVSECLYSIYDRFIYSVVSENRNIVGYNKYLLIITAVVVFGSLVIL